MPLPGSSQVDGAPCGHDREHDPARRGRSEPPDQPSGPWWAGGESAAEAPTQDLSGQPAPEAPASTAGGGQPPTQPPVAPPAAQPGSGRNWTRIGLIAGAAAVGAMWSRAPDSPWGPGPPMTASTAAAGTWARRRRRRRSRRRRGNGGGDRDGDGTGGRGPGGEPGAGPAGPAGMGGMAGGVRPGALTGGPALHGEVIVPNSDGTFTTVLVQRGEVTAVSATSITVKSADGFTQEYAVTADSKIRVAGGGGDHRRRQGRRRGRRTRHQERLDRDRRQPGGRRRARAWSAAPGWASPPTERPATATATTPAA